MVNQDMVGKIDSSENLVSFMLEKILDDYSFNKGDIVILL